MDLKRYARYLSMAALLIVMSCSGCSLHPEQSYNKSTIAMDTTIQLRAEGKEAKEAVEEGLERVHQLDSLASAQNPDSDISRINAAAGQSYVQVDPSVYEMIAIAKEYSEKTQGAWDISVGIITKLWDIGNDDQHVPSDEEIASALTHVNYKDILRELTASCWRKKGCASIWAVSPRDLPSMKFARFMKPTTFRAASSTWGPVLCMPSAGRARISHGKLVSAIPAMILLIRIWASFLLRIRP